MHFTKKYWTKVKSIFVQIRLYFTWRSPIHHNGVDRDTGGMLLADCQYSTIGDHLDINMRVSVKKTDLLTAMLKWYWDNGLQPKEKRNEGHDNNTRAYRLDGTKRTVAFISNYADADALVLPGRSSESVIMSSSINRNTRDVCNLNIAGSMVLYFQYMYRFS